MNVALWQGLQLRTDTKKTSRFTMSLDYVLKISSLIYVFGSEHKNVGTWAFVILKIHKNLWFWPLITFAFHLCLWNLENDNVRDRQLFNRLRQFTIRSNIQICILSWKRPTTETSHWPFMIYASQLETWKSRCAWSAIANCMRPRFPILSNGPSWLRGWKCPP